MTLLEIAQKVTKICGILLWKNLLPRTCKIAQSGHTVGGPRNHRPQRQTLAFTYLSTQLESYFKAIAAL